MTPVDRLARVPATWPERTDASILADFLTGLSRARSVPEGFRRLSHAVESLGFDAVAYTAIPLTLQKGLRVAPVFLVSRGFSRGFLRHYEEADLVRHDFTIERIRGGALEVMDWNAECEAQRLTEAQRTVVEVARFDYGIRHAVSIPTMADEHVIAGASASFGEGERRFEVLKRERLEKLRAIVQTFHDWVFAAPEHRHHFYSTLLEQYTDGELRLIRLVVEGHRQKSSGDRCGIAPSRAGNILSKLYAELGISNAHELAFLVGVHQLARAL